MKKIMVGVIIAVIIIGTGSYNHFKEENKIRVSRDFQSENLEVTEPTVEAMVEPTIEPTIEPVLETTNGNVSEALIDITEKMHRTWVNEIYINPKDYTDKRIKIEGMFTSYSDEKTNTTHYYVYRIGPGCCGNDGDMCGFEFTYDGELPQDKDWIEVTGTLRLEGSGDMEYLVLRADTVVVKSERGAENVYH